MQHHSDKRTKDFGPTCEHWRKCVGCESHCLRPSWKLTISFRLGDTVVSSAHHCSTTAFTFLHKASLWIFQRSCSQKASLAASKTSRLPHALDVFLLSNQAKSLPLPTPEVDANVHNISFAMTILDYFAPTKCSLIPSLILDITKCCIFTVSKSLRKRGIMSFI
jgi:hypothetical protein